MEDYEYSFRPMVEHNAYVVVIKSDYSVVRRWDCDGEEEELEKEHGKRVCKSIYSSIKKKEDSKEKSKWMERLEKVLNS
jgi:hypothetical protein